MSNEVIRVSKHNRKAVGVAYIDAGIELMDELLDMDPGPEADDTNPKDLIGLTKAPLRLVPPALVIQTAPAMANGAEKYGPYNWREKSVRLSIYLEAIERHLLAYRDGEEASEDSKVSHLAHMAACIAIIFDAQSLGKLIDDRPPKGAAAELLDAQVKGN